VSTGFAGTEATEVTEEDCWNALADCEATVPIDSCESEKGACDIYQDYTSCDCADGSNSGGEEPGDDGETDPEEPPVDGGGSEPAGRIMEAACEAILAEQCPNDPPDPAESCETAALDLCNNMAAFAEECWDEHVWPYQIVTCCDDYSAGADRQAEIDAMWGCLETKGCEKRYRMLRLWRRGNARGRRLGRRSAG